MSSYLNAFLIGDFKYISNINDKLPDDTLHRIIVRPDSLTKAPYALENSIAALKALETYVNFKYEISKMDSAGVPGKTNGKYFFRTSLI
jgi:aminopeptidase N